MYQKVTTRQFRKSFRKLMKSGSFDYEETEKVIDLLVKGAPLPDKYRDHGLRGEFIGMRECHIKPDLLLIYQIHEDELVLLLLNIGSHSELFS